MKKLLFLLTLTFIQTTVHADLASMKKRLPELVKAKKAGLIGEQPDGLVGAIKGEQASQKVQRLVLEENKDRKSIYKTRAQKAGQSLDVFQKVIGEARINREKSGRYIKTPQKNMWIKK